MLWLIARLASAPQEKPTFGWDDLAGGIPAAATIIAAVVYHWRRRGQPRPTPKPAPSRPALDTRPIAVRRVEEAEQRAKARVDREALFPVGSDEWRKVRYRHHCADIAIATRVRWDERLYRSARTTGERSARDMMTGFKADDRALVAAAKTRRRERSLTKFERATGVTSWEEAERFVFGWLRSQFPGRMDLSPSGADRGIDIEGDRVVAQVKFWPAKPVGRPEIQQLQGAAAGKRPLFFAFETAGTVRPLASGQMNTMWRCSCLTTTGWFNPPTNPRNVSLTVFDSRTGESEVGLKASSPIDAFRRGEARSPRGEPQRIASTKPDPPTAFMPCLAAERRCALRRSAGVVRPLTLRQDHEVAVRV